MAEPNVQPYSLPHTEVRSLTAQSSGVEYQIYVNFPRDRAARDKPLPALIVLDADYSFAIASNVLEHFTDRGNIAPMILVGIAYPGQSQDMRNYRMQRSRDYTPIPHPSDGYGAEFMKESGGGPKFLRFIEEELIPFLATNYSIDTNDVGISGHSFGGLITSWALMNNTKAFRRYIIVSPSLWYADRFMFEAEKSLASSREPIVAEVFMGVGEYENQPHNGRAMVDDLEAFGEQLDSYGYPELNITTHVFPGETHNSVYPSAITRGLLRVYGR
ncbi:MAG: esterase [Phycisphaerae bacterium]|nr:MAG: esterase [Phycisphaerae bacterium]